MSFPLFENAELESIEEVLPREIALKVSTSSWTKPDWKTDWSYDLFTPPSVYYDRVQSKFTVVFEDPIPWYQVAADSLFLSSIYHSEYRFQFRGHHGEEGNYTIVIYDRKKEKWILSKLGENYESFVIKSFTVKKAVLPGDKSSDFCASEEIELILWDKARSREYTIEKSLTYDEKALALLCDSKGTEFILSIGDSFCFLDYEASLLAIDEIKKTITISISPLGKDLFRELELKLTEYERGKHEWE